MSKSHCTSSSPRHLQSQGVAEALCVAQPGGLQFIPTVLKRSSQQLCGDRSAAGLAASGPEPRAYTIDDKPRRARSEPPPHRKCDRGSEAWQTAAKAQNLEALPRRKHFNNGGQNFAFEGADDHCMTGRTHGACLGGTVPCSSESWDMSPGSSPFATRRKFFDQSCRADQYAMLLDRQCTRQGCKKSDWLDERERGWKIVGSWWRTSSVDVPDVARQLRSRGCLTTLPGITPKSQTTDSPHASLRIACRTCFIGYPSSSNVTSTTASGAASVDGSSDDGCLTNIMEEDTPHSLILEDGTPHFFERAPATATTYEEEQSSRPLSRQSSRSAVSNYSSSPKLGLGIRRVMSSILKRKDASRLLQGSTIEAMELQTALQGVVDDMRGRAVAPVTTSKQSSRLKKEENSTVRRAAWKS